MQVIAEQVYIEEQYPGVVLGAISLGHGLIQIDAPPAPEDGRSWRATLLSLNSGVERFLVNLDSHPDRTLGVRAMDCTVIAHEKTAQAFRNRPNAFKSQPEETGADWEAVVGLGTVRWAPPEITFTEHMEIQWGNVPVILEHHPGPTSGAVWVHIPVPKVIFIGDLVLKGQPPFLANANLVDWMASLEQLLSGEYDNSLIVSSRGGLIGQREIEDQLTLMKEIHLKVESVGKSPESMDELEAIIPGLIAGLQPAPERLKQYTQRLRHGLRQSYLRRYHPTTSLETEEE
ncbi:MAG: MBL fold metallo-hydrolase [Anaerolineales bacterium]|jgi:glyoxylase-like metal-dependent hydrolase (beta-lactamase superfamily II)|nr:MBL fold metallo-hydrolase [Anaerolineales bacterium]